MLLPTSFLTIVLSTSYFLVPTFWLLRSGFSYVLAPPTCYLLLATSYLLQSACSGSICIRRSGDMSVHARNKEGLPSSSAHCHEPPLLGAHITYSCKVVLSWHTTWRRVHRHLDNKRQKGVCSCIAHNATYALCKCFFVSARDAAMSPPSPLPLLSFFCLSAPYTFFPHLQLPYRLSFKANLSGFNSSIYSLFKNLPFASLCTSSHAP